MLGLKKVISSKYSGRYTFDWGMRIYGSIENLFTISSYNKYGDPEIGTGRLNLVGYDSGRYPYQRTYSVGISLQF